MTTSTHSRSSPKELQSNLRVVILLRFLILSISYFLFILPVYFAGLKLFQHNFWPVYGIFGVAFFLNFVYRSLILRIQNYESFIVLQIIIDIILMSALVYLTGANYSNFVFLYFVAILASSILTTSNRGFLLTSLSASFLAIITGLYTIYYFVRQELPPFCIRETIPEPTDSLYIPLGYLVVEILSFYLVFFLSSNLTNRLKSVKVLYDEVLLNLAESMLIIGQQDQIYFINQEALELFRFETRDSLIGKHLGEVFRRESDQELRDILSQKESLKKEIVFKIGSDEELPLEIKSSIIKDERGRNKFSIVIFRDLSLQKKGHETEKRLTKLEAVREMSAEIAHEIKNPLASILGSAQELSKMEVNDPIYKKLIKIVTEETERINEIVNGFLKFARIAPTKLERCSLSSILEEIVIMLQNRITDQEIIIEKDIPAELFCEGDKNQLKQLFLNLGINAIESIQGNGRVRISAEYRKDIQQQSAKSERRRKTSRSEIRVSISDTGIGIDPDLEKNIFKPFFTTKPTGTGMGLSVVDWIVHAHNGTITWTSTKGQGTTFNMNFPAI